MKNRISSSEDLNFCSSCNLRGHKDKECATHQQHFIWRFGGQQVFIVGSWSQWQIRHEMKQVDDLPWFTFNINLSPGTYHYKYIVDGIWRFDPNEHYEKNNYDEFDNVIEVFPAMYEVGTDIEDSDSQHMSYTQSKQGLCVRIFTELIGQKISVKGSWDNWKKEIQCKKEFNPTKKTLEFSTFLKLNPGVYHYKFVVDGIFQHDPNKMKVNDTFGGFNNIIKVKEKDKINVTSNFDINSLKWYKVEEESDVNFSAVQGLSMSAIGEQLIIFGGLTRGKYINSIHCVNLETNEFYQIENVKGNLPDPRAYHQSIELGNKIIVYGGLSQNGYFDDYWTFNNNLNLWQESPTVGDIPSKREKFTLTKISNEILVLFGGYFCSEEMDHEENFNDVFTLNLQLMQWDNLNIKGEQPVGRSGHTACFYKGRLYIFGGVKLFKCSPQKCFNDIHIIDFNNQELKWNSLSQQDQIKGKPPIARYGHTAAVIDHYMIINGGKIEKTQFLDDTVIFDFRTLSWLYPKIGGDIPGGRCWHACAVTNNEIYMFGGTKGKFYDKNRGKLYIYKLSNKQQKKQEFKTPQKNSSFSD